MGKWQSSGGCLIFLAHCSTAFGTRLENRFSKCVLVISQLKRVSAVGRELPYQLYLRTSAIGKTELQVQPGNSWNRPFTIILSFYLLIHHYTNIATARTTCNSIVSGLYIHCSSLWLRLGSNKLNQSTR
jgi:hypothetical protein